MTKGTMVLNNLKTYMQREGNLFFLTFADNNAIEFFQKQGFTIRITQPRERWVGWIKDYEGGTLMKCRVSPTIDFLHMKETIVQQKKCIYEKIKQVSNSHIVYPGLTVFGEHKLGEVSVDIKEIDGVRQSLANKQADVPREPNLAALQNELRYVLTAITHHPDAWPFLQPVDTTAVVDYLQVITDPIDLSTIEKRLDHGKYYRTKYIFCADLIRMCENCRLYNRRDTPYYQCANHLESFIREHSTLTECLAEGLFQRTDRDGST